MTLYRSISLLEELAKTKALNYKYFQAIEVALNAIECSIDVEEWDKEAAYNGYICSSCSGNGCASCKGSGEQN
jgi:hypothetical protein